MRDRSRQAAEQGLGQAITAWRATKPGYTDNLCFRPDGRVALVDWNWAGRGNRAGDVAFWLNTVKLEGGPVPEAMWEAVDPGLRAIVAGYMAATASDVPLPHLPRVRPFQKAQLEVSLPWAAAGLGLPLP